jgi:hypothetical protein
MAKEDYCYITFGSYEIRLEADFEKIREELRFGRNFDAISADGTRLLVVPGPGLILSTGSLK